MKYLQQFENFSKREDKAFLSSIFTDIKKTFKIENLTYLPDNDDIDKEGYDDSFIYKDKYYTLEIVKIVTSSFLADYYVKLDKVTVDSSYLQSSKIFNFFKREYKKIHG